ncbi:hypothetical protein ACSLO8_21340, partial [Escherichia coli]
MIIKRTPQAASPLASWLSYLENLHSKTIDLGLERVSQVANGIFTDLQPAGTQCR